MRKVLLYSLLLVVGLIASQLAPSLPGAGVIRLVVQVLTMWALAFIMIHVGYEFDIDKSRPGQYVWDYVVAFTAAAFPWVFCALYFVYVLAPRELWLDADLWKESLLAARFASPTSAGVLFSMLAAAGLSATWLFKKARVLAIFDDLDTILLMIPLKMLMVGLRWQLGIVVVAIIVMLVLAWRHLHRMRLPISWPYVIAYAGIITLACEGIHLGSKAIDQTVPIHLEVLLPAFVLGCMLARPAGQDPHRDDGREGHEEGPEAPQEQRVATIVSACFMVLVGLSMPSVRGGVSEASGVEVVAVAVGAEGDEPFPFEGVESSPGEPKRRFAGVSPEVLVEKNRFPGWGVIAMHVLLVTLLSNVGKMFPAFVYRKEAPWRHRLAVAIGMFPRGEVGAGVLVVSLAYGLVGPVVTVAALSLALNLLCTGLFVVIVKRLIGHVAA